MNQNESRGMEQRAVGSYSEETDDHPRFRQKYAFVKSNQR